jgi:hypothetical protein
VFAVHDHSRWDLGFSVEGGGQERPDARWSAVECAVPGERFFVSDVDVMYI